MTQAALLDQRTGAEDALSEGVLVEATALLQAVSTDDVRIRVVVVVEIWLTPRMRLSRYGRSAYRPGLCCRGVPSGSTSTVGGRILLRTISASDWGSRRV